MTLFQIVLQDDHLPMHVDKTSEVDAVLEVVWVSSSEKEELVQCETHHYTTDTIVTDNQ